MRHSVRNLLILLFVLLLGACRRGAPAGKPDQMELWYWHHSYLVTPEAVQKSKALIDRAAHAGYTGVALWDSSLTFLSGPNWPAQNVEYLREVVRYAAGRGLRVMPIAAPYGYSNEALRTNPNWAEGQRVIGTRFRVDDTGKQLVQLKSLSKSAPVSARPMLALEVPLTPWRQYHIRFFCRTQGFHGLSQVEVSDGASNHLDANLHPPPDRDWTAYDYTFNSAESSKVRILTGAFGGHAGEILIDRFSLEETALIYVLRRTGTPLRVYDPDNSATTFKEGTDFQPIHDQKLLNTQKFDNDYFHDPGPVVIPAGSRLRAGQTVAMDYYAAEPVYDFQVGMCLTEPAVAEWVTENARKLSDIFPQGSGLLLSHDEMRHMNSCASCRARKLTAGELLAWSFQQTTKSLEPYKPLYVWSDMFDPNHNARDHFYFVEGTIRGSWKGLPPDITMMNWNRSRASLTWFSGDDPRQPIPYRQIVSGYYDPPDHNGAAAASSELSHATGLPGIVGMMYTTWQDDYSQLEAYGAAARKAWERYRRSRPL